MAVYKLEYSEEFLEFGFVDVELVVFADEQGKIKVVGLNAFVV